MKGPISAAENVNSSEDGFIALNITENEYASSEYC